MRDYRIFREKCERLVVAIQKKLVCHTADDAIWELIPQMLEKAGRKVRPFGLSYRQRADFLVPRVLSSFTRVAKMFLTTPQNVFGSKTSHGRCGIKVFTRSGQFLADRVVDGYQQLPIAKFSIDVQDMMESILSCEEPSLMHKRFIHGESAEASASTLGVSSRTVRRHFNDAIEKLRRAMQGTSSFEDFLPSCPHYFVGECPGAPRARVRLSTSPVPNAIASALYGRTPADDTARCRPCREARRQTAHNLYAHRERSRSCRDSYGNTSSSDMLYHVRLQYGFHVDADNSTQAFRIATRMLRDNPGSHIASVKQPSAPKGKRSLLKRLLTGH